MACNFTVNFMGGATEKVAKAKKEVETNGGTFNGNEVAGNFKVPVPLMSNIEGSYKVSKQVISFNIAKKPILVSCGKVQSFLEEQFAE